jgi:hypothetical protein
VLMLLQQDENLRSFLLKFNFDMPQAQQLFRLPACDDAGKRSRRVMCGVECISDLLPSMTSQTYGT